VHWDSTLTHTLTKIFDMTKQTLLLGCGSLFLEKAARQEKTLPSVSPEERLNRGLGLAMIHM